MQKQHPTYLSIFGLVMMNVAAVMSLRGMPMIANTGLTMLFYLLFACVLFLVPCSLVAAELATGWPGSGGVYRWVRAAFGPKLGFIAIWLQWVQNVVWFPTVLTFAASSLAYLFVDPHLATNNLYIAGFIVGVYWLATLIALRGLHVAGMVTTIGVIAGTIAPGVLMIVLGAIWVLGGHHVAFMMPSMHFFPQLSDLNSIAFLAGIVLLFAGMEVGAVHVRELRNPTKDYPRAVLYSVLIIIVVFSLGALAIASIIPAKQISLTAGLLEAFNQVLGQFHLHWLLPVLGLMIAFGSVAGVMAWIAGPSKGVLATAKDGEIPPFLAKTNNKGMQSHILLIQGGIVTVLASFYLWFDNVNAVFFLLSAMTVSLYLVMYLLMYAAAIWLRYSQPDVPRAYRIPGGNWGMWLVAGLGILAALFAFVVAFIPPARLQFGSPQSYVITVVGGLVIFIAIPVIMHSFKKQSWLSHPYVDPE
jgi:putative glutamate/gamma-aminobutyrate antiporter